jgi:nitroreductase
MEFEHVIKTRHTTTSFKNKMVSWKHVLDAINDALQGPYAGNYNNLRFIIVENPETIKKLAIHANQLWIGATPIVIVVCSDEKQAENLYGERGRIYSRHQAGAAIHTITLSLANRGIQSAWVGAFNDSDVRFTLKIPPRILVEALIPVGYETHPVKRKRKSALSAVLNWEKWDLQRRPTAFEEGTKFKEIH